MMAIGLPEAAHRGLGGAGRLALGLAAAHLDHRDLAGRRRGAAAAGDEVSVVNMGGEGVESQETRATEASVRGFWKAYRRYMGA